MADFCAECSIEEFGEDLRDMAGSSKPEDTANGLFSQALCEGCDTPRGMILIDHDGIRVTALEKETRVVDGEERSFFLPRPDEEIAKARAFVAAHQRTRSSVPSQAWPHDE